MQKRKVWILGFFPEVFESFREMGVVGKAISGERDIPYEFEFVSLFDLDGFGHKDFDAAPYGGGPGMVLKADTLERALLQGIIGPGEYGENWKDELHVIYPSPRGRIWTSKDAQDFFTKRKNKDLIFICGRYEGIDERFLEEYVDEFISLGPYIISGGELAVLNILDSSLRFVPGVLGNSKSTEDESYTNGNLEYPQYTRPLIFNDKKVPAVLTSGDHQAISKYRQQESERLTKELAQDLKN